MHLLLIACSLCLLWASFERSVTHARFLEESDVSLLRRITPEVFFPQQAVPLTHNESQRIAIVVTLAGDRKLAQYFEWSCRSVAASRSIADLLVFHENNQRLQDVRCAPNVKFVNLGERGLSQLIAKQILGPESHEDVVNELVLVLHNVLTHMPRFLVEVKPMTGSLFANHLSQYSHWTYSDPDILWGDVSRYLSPSDLRRFDIVSFAKHFDAARLFLRGQFTLHRNTEKLNNLWRMLSYFKQENIASRLGTAYRMLLAHKSADEVFRVNFHSAEGWYSHLVFEQALQVKIVGMVFDDFFREPVVWLRGHLSRCSVLEKLSDCVTRVQRSLQNDTNVVELPAPRYKKVQASADSTQCKMWWLPVEVRYCITESVYDKADALTQDAQEDVKLVRAGEVILKDNSWFANDEMEAPRQVPEWAALFHFRHWDDFIALKHEVSWPNAAESDMDCMVMYLKFNRALAFEDCSKIAEEESHNKRLVLGNSINTLEGKQNVKELLAHHRWEIEVGQRSSSSSSKKKDSRGEKAHLRSRGHHSGKGKKGKQRAKS